MADAVTSGAIHAGKATFAEGLKVLVEIIVPVGAVLAGFFTGAALGGARSVANAIWGATGSGNVTGTSINRLSGAIMAAIWAAVGYAFWSFRKSGGIVMAALGGGIGGYFYGAAASNIPTVLSGNQAANGWLDNFASGLGNVAQGG